MTKSKTATILITGATGNVGRELTRQLSEQKMLFRAMVRSIGEARKLPGFVGTELVAGDFNEPETVFCALEGMERAFLLTNSSELAENQQSTFVDLAYRAGVKHIVKLSQWAAAEQSPVRFLRYHAAVERKIKDSGIAYTFLRPNLFMQGLLGFREPIARQSKFFAPIGDAKISVVDVRDIAAVAAVALTEQGHEGKTYDITGPESLSHQEMAEKLSTVVNHKVQFVNIPPLSMREMLISVGFPVWQAEGLIEDYAHYSRNEASEVSLGVLEATGNLPRSFEDFARHYAPAFQLISSR